MHLAHGGWRAAAFLRLTVDWSPLRPKKGSCAYGLTARARASIDLTKSMRERLQMHAADKKCYALGHNNDHQPIGGQLK